MDRFSPRTAGLAALAVLLLLAALATPPSRQDLPAFGLLGLSTLFLELAAVPLPGLGFASLGMSGYLAATLWLGWRPAALLAVFSLGARSLARGRSSLPGRLLEGLQDLVPALAAGFGAWLVAKLFPEHPVVVTVGALQGLLVGLVTGFVAADEAPPALARARSRLLPLTALNGLLGVLGVVLLEQGAWTLLLLLPCQLAITVLASFSVIQDEQADRRELARDLRSQGRQLGQLQEEVDRVRQDLGHQLDQYLVLEQWTRGLASEPRVEAVLEHALNLVARLVPARSVVIFREDGGLYPAAFRSPDAQKLEAARLLKTVESLAEQAFSSGQRAQAAASQRASILEQEHVAVAFPLPGFGALYAGREEGPEFNEHELRLLAVLSSQAALALSLARHFEAQEASLQENAEIRAQLEAWVESLDALLAGAARLASAPEPEAVLEALVEAVRGQLPAEGLVIFLGSSLQARRVVPSDLALEPARAVAAAVTSNLRPLLVEDLASTRFTPLRPGHASLLAAPLLGEEGSAGVLVLSSARAAAFTRTHQELLQVLGYQAAAALNSARLHEETREAYRKLQESEVQLVHSSKMAAVGQLAAGIAHELNTPLGTVVLSLDMLSTMVNQPKLVERIELAMKEALRAQTIVDTLLVYSREGSRQRAPVDLNRLVRDTLLLVDYQLRQTGVSAELALSSLPQVPCNANEIQQVLINLLLNARDAVEGQPEERKLLRVRSRLEGEEAVLDVEDRGCGVPADIRPRLFEPFFTTKPVGRGTGLGLSLSLQLVTGHAGSLTFRDHPEGGTVFRLRLPLGAG